MSAFTHFRRRPYLPKAVATALIALFLLVCIHVAGTLIDFKSALALPQGLDYGEGIVWQQAVLMFGPRMYSPSEALPFIVFHYPPMFHFAVRVLMTIGMDPVFAGRFISTSSTIISSLIIVSLVMLCVPRGSTVWRSILAWSAGGMFVLLYAVREWASFMRVDTLAVALGLAGTLIALRSGGRTWMLTLALLCCLADMFTKQTQFPAGISILLVGLLCWRSATIVATSITLVIGVAGALVLELATHGFFKNIISYNVNSYSFGHGLHIVMVERSSWPFGLAMALGGLLVALPFRQSETFTRLRRGDPVIVGRALILVHFILAAIMLPMIFKIGSSNNYFLDAFAFGAALIGIALCDLQSRPWLLLSASIVLFASIVHLPLRLFHDDRLAAGLKPYQLLVDQIRRADKPVASEDMVANMRAGKPLIYEPAIVTELIANGRWDPAPLVEMIRNHGFAFVVSQNPTPLGGPVIESAIAAAYPRLAGPDAGMWRHLPAVAEGASPK